MREIKFRLWNDYDKEMLNWSYLLERNLANIFTLPSYKKWLMQYTGLKDKNGKEIYEGDIIRKVFYKYSNDEFGKKGFYELICKIIWKDGLGFTFREIKENEIEMPEDYKESYDEIIGNIYENPELLEDK